MKSEFREPITGRIIRVNNGWFNNRFNNGSLTEFGLLGIILNEICILTLMGLSDRNLNQLPTMMERVHLECISESGFMGCETLYVPGGRQFLSCHVELIVDVAV